LGCSTTPGSLEDGQGDGVPETRPFQHTGKTELVQSGAGSFGVLTDDVDAGSDRLEASSLPAVAEVLGTRHELAVSDLAGEGARARQVTAPGQDAQSDASFGDQEERVAVGLGGSEPALGVDAGSLVTFQEDGPGKRVLEPRKQRNLGPAQVHRAETSLRVQQARIAHTDRQHAAELIPVQVAGDPGDSLEHLLQGEGLTLAALSPVVSMISMRLRFRRR
jgi:hypothetical protein